VRTPALPHRERTPVRPDAGIEIRRDQVHQRIGPTCGDRARVVGGRGVGQCGEGRVDGHPLVGGEVGIQPGHPVPGGLQVDEAVGHRRAVSLLGGQGVLRELHPTDPRSQLGPGEHRRPRQHRGGYPVRLRVSEGHHLVADHAGLQVVDVASLQRVRHLRQSFQRRGGQHLGLAACAGGAEPCGDLVADERLASLPLATAPQLVHGMRLPRGGPGRDPLPRGDGFDQRGVVDLGRFERRECRGKLRPGSRAVQRHREWMRVRPVRPQIR